MVGATWLTCTRCDIVRSMVRREIVRSILRLIVRLMVSDVCFLSFSASACVGLRGL